MLLTTLDVAGRRNNREHHVIEAFRPRFDRVTVVFRRRGQGGAGNLLRGETEVSDLDGVTYVAVDPPLNPREGTVRELTRDGVPGGGARRALGLALDTLAIGRDAATVRALAQAARRHCRRGEPTICEAFGPWATAAALPLRTDGLVAAVVYIDRDYEPGFMKSSLRRRWAVRAERRAAAAADLTLSISPRLAKRLRDVPGATVRLSPTGVDRERFMPARGAEPSAHLVFVGQVAPWSGIEEALDALVLLRTERPEARLTVMGPCEPAYARVLQDRIAALELGDRVTWEGDRPRDAVAEAIRQAGIGLSVFRPHPLRIHAAPLKLLEYLAAGLPVVALEGSAAGDLVVQTGTGATCAATGEGIADAVAGLLDRPEEYRRMSVAGRRVAREYDWEHVLLKEYRMLEALWPADAEGTAA